MQRKGFLKKRGGFEMWLDIKSLIVFFTNVFVKASWSWFVDGHKAGTEQIERRRGYNFTIFPFYNFTLLANIRAHVCRQI